MSSNPIPSRLRQVGNLEAFLMGGLSILAYLGFVLFMNKGANVYTVATIAFSLAFIVNYPHFMASYYILYKDNLRKFFTNWRYAWAGIVAPLLLLAGFILIFFFQEKAWLGYMVNIMFFTVGWHYVKQIFGCIVVSNIFKGYFYQPLDRRILLFNLYALWGMSWLPGNLYGYTFNYYNLQYHGLNVAGYIHDALLRFGIATDTFQIGRFLVIAILACVTISLVYVTVSHILRYVKTGTLPHIAGFLAFVSIYLWYIPTFAHPAYAYLIPFLHSLQYLALVRVYKMNMEDSLAETVSDERKRKLQVVLGLTVFTSVTVALGAILFSFLPELLDRELSVLTLGLGSQAFLISFILFINIHHYFIDNVIWRKDNELVRKYLFGRE